MAEKAKLIEGNSQKLEEKKLEEKSPQLAKTQFKEAKQARLIDTDAKD